MGIRRRLSIPKRLAYHREYGSIETVPSRERSWTSSGSLQIVCGPNTGRTGKSYHFPRSLHKVELHRIPLGLLYHRHKGIGPGQGFTAWVNTNLGLGDPAWRYVGEFVPKQPWEESDSAYRPWPEMKLWYQAMAAITEAYEEAHGVTLPVPWVPTRQSDLYIGDDKERSGGTRRGH